MTAGARCGRSIAAANVTQSYLDFQTGDGICGNLTEASSPDPALVPWCNLHALHDQRHLVLNSPAMQCVRDRYAALFSPVTEKHHAAVHVAA